MHNLAKTFKIKDEMVAIFYAILFDNIFYQKDRVKCIYLEKPLNIYEIFSEQT